MGKYYTYILYSKKIDKYYVGSTDNLEWRLERHNMDWGKYTKRGIPWIMVYNEKYHTKKEALKRELEIKKKKSKKYIESLINPGGRPAMREVSRVPVTPTFRGKRDRPRKTIKLS